MTDKYKKIEEVPDEFWENQVNPVNREIIEEFLSQQHLSPHTLKQYRSALKIFAKWVHDFQGNKNITDLKPRHGLQFQNWLLNKGLSNNSVRFKRGCVSSLCNFIEVYYNDEYPNFRNIFTKAVKNVPKENKKEKQPLTPEEIETLIKVLEERNEWQKIAYILFTYSSGCRRAEARQLLKEVINYEKHKDKDGNEKPFYITHPVRAKGPGKEGKIRRLAFDERAMQAIKKWIEYRQTLVDVDDCPYVFVAIHNNKFKQISPTTFNLWCEEFSEILGGRPFYPHLLRTSRSTNLAIYEGKSIEAIQALLGHESPTTTQIYIVKDNSEDLDDLFD